ncbi:MAG: phosphatase PAP2 family protein [Pseudomonadota bacterium]
MRLLSGRTAVTLCVVASVLIFATAGLIGGLHFSPDTRMISELAFERSARYGLTEFAIILTLFGGAPALLAILLLAVTFLADAKRWRDLLSLTAIVIGGRIAIELLKLAIDRSRPAFDPYPVDVHSMSFPSGHAGNSMITFLAISLIAAPPRRRGRAVAIALVASLLVGATRPILGVHWPSDVIGGWALGIGWVVGLEVLTRRWRSASK